MTVCVRVVSSVSLPLALFLHTESNRLAVSRICIYERLSTLPAHLCFRFPNLSVPSVGSREALFVGGNSDTSQQLCVFLGG